MAIDDLPGTRDATVYADFFLPYLDEMTHVLDLGCGDGALSIGLASRAGQVTAVDTVPDGFADAVAYCKAHAIDSVSFVEGDATGLTFEGRSFDACLCHSLLEFGIDPAVVLAEM